MSCTRANYHCTDKWEKLLHIVSGGAAAFIDLFVYIWDGLSSFGQVIVFSTPHYEWKMSLVGASLSEPHPTLAGLQMCVYTTDRACGYIL